MDVSDDTQHIASVIRRETASTSGYIYLVRLYPSGRTTYVRWQTVPHHVQQAYLEKHPSALEDEKHSQFQSPETLKAGKRGPKPRRCELHCLHFAECCWTEACRRKAGARIAGANPSGRNSERRLSRLRNGGCRSRASRSTQRATQGATDTTRLREAWPQPVPFERKLASVAAYRNDMSFRTVEQHVCLVLGTQHCTADGTPIKCADGQTVTLIARVLSANSNAKAPLHGRCSTSTRRSKARPVL
jgi:hypothetical protein